MHWWFGHRVNAHSLEGLIQPEMGFQKEKVFRLPRKRKSVLAALIACHVISLAVIFIEVVSLVNHLSTSKVQRDLHVPARGMAKFSKLLLLFPKLLSLTGWQPRIGFSGEVIGLIIEHLRSPHAGVEVEKKMGSYMLCFLFKLIKISIQSVKFAHKAIFLAACYYWYLFLSYSSSLSLCWIAFSRPAFNWASWWGR